MKKILMSFTIACLLSGSALAGQPLKSGTKTSFDIVPWSSKSPDQIVTITNSSIMKNVLVLITVSRSTGEDFPSAGMNIKNCGNVSHVDVGSSVICPLSSDGLTPVTISSDKQGVYAYGNYQIERQ